jgi:outer membrane protein OmpA-like peptidoglycan-associated protein
MVVSERDAQARRAKKPGQAGVRGSSMPRAVGMLAAAGWLLGGCSTLSGINPVNWWHQQQGGKIAEQRPAPPGADQAYPNLATVPAKPDAPDAEALKKLTDSLVADRTNAQHAAQSSPLADPSSPTTSPGLFGVGTAPPPPPPGVKSPAAAGTAATGAPVASASMPAVNAPPQPATPPSPAPRKAVQSTPLDAPTVASPPAPAASAPAPSAPVTSPPAPSAPGPSAASPPAAPPSSAAANVGAQPALPMGPPPRPSAAPTPPPQAVAPTPMPPVASGVTAAIVFLNGASDLTAPAADEVKAFAAKRGNGTISITGYGDSASSDPDAQSAAVNLGLSRAQSIVDALKAAGVPGNAIRVSAEASGRGASLHLIQ